MATRLKHRTVVFVGGGFTAALAARQLTAKGVDALVLERGDDHTHSAATSCPRSATNCAGTSMATSFRIGPSRPTRFAIMVGSTALPIRRLQAFKPGEGMGGAANHWNGQTWRWGEHDRET